ncbi:MAG: type II toxin-antitoxin system VapC family toxin [bacterium]
MTKRLLLDTDVLIDFLRGQPQAVQLLEDTDCEFHVSAVSVAELYGGVRDGREREVLDQLMGLLRTIEISTEIARQAGLWRREYGKSHGTGIIDALIAACADASQIPLATLNVKHFPMLPRVSAPYRK